MRSFLSPAERHLLDSLPASERDLVDAMFQELDAHLVEDENGQQPNADPLFWVEPTRQDREAA